MSLAIKTPPLARIRRRSANAPPWRASHDWAAVAAAPFWLLFFPALVFAAGCCLALTAIEAFVERHDDPD